MNNPFAQAGAAAPSNGLEVEESGSSRKMPHPETGVRKSFPRSSTWGGVISDDYTLTEWKMAMTALSIGKNRDLYALANSQPEPEEDMEFRASGWWNPWNEVAHKGIDRVKANSGAHLGTAIHAWREQLELGRITIGQVPPEWREHLRAFQRMHAEHGMEFCPSYVEQLVVNTSLHNGVCGRLDNLRRLPNGDLIVDDTKTGKNAPMGMDEIAIQLAIYAHSPYHWRPHHPDAVHGYVPAPPNIRKDVATISWVPINRPENSRIIPVDIAWGWEAAKAVAWVKGYRNRSKRKRDGLELNLDSILNGASAYRETSVSPFDLSGEIRASDSLAVLASVIREAIRHDRWSIELEREATAHAVALKAR